MTTLDIATAAGIACGVLMVSVSMFLLARGAISLNTKRSGGGASLEIKNVFRLATDNPALGLFVMGLAFILASAAMARSADSRITVVGFLKDVDIENPDDLHILLGSSMQDVVDTSTQQIQATADTNGLRRVIISYPGYRQVDKPVDRGVRKVNLGEIHLVKVAAKPEGDLHIVPVPGGFNERQGTY
jgi:hypothetical protein